MKRFLCWLFCVLLAGCSSSSGSPDAVDSSNRTDSADAGDVDGMDAAQDVGDPVDLQPDTPKPPAHWVEIADAPRIAYHEVVSLVDGRALVLGGRRYVGPTPEVEKTTWLFDPATSSFKKAGDLKIDRRNFTATVLESGKVLVAGGRSEEGYQKSTEIFDPTTATWSEGPAMLTHRWGHSAVRLADGRVLVTGGFALSDSSTTAWLYDPQSNDWTTSTTSMKEPRRFHGSVLLGSKRVLIAGGIQGLDSSPEYSDSFEIYDPSTGSFALSSVKMSRGRISPTLISLEDGRVFIAGGYCGGKDCAPYGHDIYDPISGQVAPIAHPGPVGAVDATAKLHDGRLLVISGRYDPLKMHLFDPQKGWSSAPDALFLQDAAMATILGDGTVLLVGGITDYDVSPYAYADRAQRFYP